MIVVVVTIFFSKQCKLLYKSIIFYHKLDLGFVISGTFMFLAVNPYLDLYIAYSIHYKNPYPIVICTVYILLFCYIFNCSFSVWNTMMGTSLLSIPWAIEQVCEF